MIVDTSAVLAIIFDEPECDMFLQAIALSTEPVRISTAHYVECGMVVDRAGNDRLSERRDDFFSKARIIFEAVTQAQAQFARQAYKDFGKGSGHPAQLNFGDSFAYAIAKDKGELLLFTGNDFSHTDIQAAV